MSRQRRGATTAELSLIIGPMALIIFGGIDVGMAMWYKQLGTEVLRAAARSASAKSAAVALPAVESGVFTDPEIFDERQTAIDISPEYLQGGTLDSHFASLPAANRLLRSIMYLEVRSDVSLDGIERQIFRLPGILLWNASGEIAAQADLIVRVTDGSAHPGVLLPVIQIPPATDAVYQTRGVVRIRCHLWYPNGIGFFPAPKETADEIWVGMPDGFAMVDPDLAGSRFTYLSNATTVRQVCEELTVSRLQNAGMSMNVHRFRGNAILELVVCLVPAMYLAFGGVEFGAMVWYKQQASEAARVAAREASTRAGNLVLPLDAAQVFSDPGVFDEQNTAIDIHSARLVGGSLDTHFESLPLVHQTLRPLMFIEARGDMSPLGVVRTFLRLPGVLLWDGSDIPGSQQGKLVRVTDGSPGPDATLIRIIDPPMAGDVAYTDEGILTMRCNIWYPAMTSILGGSVPVYTGAVHVPAGYSVIGYGTVHSSQVVHIAGLSLACREIR